MPISVNRDLAKRKAELLVFFFPTPIIIKQYQITLNLGPAIGGQSTHLLDICPLLMAMLS
jgi:hypothetical protein